MRSHVPFPIAVTLLLALCFAAAASAQDFTWTGWFGPPESNPAWGHDWASEGNTYSNGWGHVWPYYEDPIPHYPGPSSDVLIPEGVMLDIEGGIAAQCGDLVLFPGAQLLFPQSSLAIHGPTFTNNGHVHAWGITGMGGCFELFDSLEITGTGDVELNSAQIVSWQAEAALTLGPDQLLHGIGALGWEPYGNYHGIALTNQGVIRAEGAVSQLSILGTTVANHGLVEAVGQSALRLWGTWDNTGGEIHAADDAVITLFHHGTHRAIIDGGLLRTSGNGEFRVTSDASVENVTLDGLLHIQRSSNIHMADTITNLGVINQGYEGGFGPATVYVDSALTFLGDGELRVGYGNAVKMRQFPDHNAVLTNGPDHTIVSDGGYIGENPDYYGDQRLELVNDGTIICQDSSYRNEFRLAGAGFTNRGTVVIEPSPTQTTFLWGDYTQTAGRLECDDVMQMQEADCRFVVNGGEIVGQGGLSGPTVIGPATIHPGDAGEIGTLDIWGDLTLNDGAVLVCEWAHNQKDRLAVHGRIAATGAVALQVVFLELDAPVKAADYTLVTCDEIDDQATWTLDLPDGWTYDALVWDDGRLVVQGMSGMPTSAPELPGALALHGAAPNPFNPATSVRFALDHDGPVRLWVSDVAGRHVRTLVDGRRPAGEHRVVWDGRDDSGRGVGSGTYLSVLEADGRRLTRAMSLVR